MSEDTPAMRSHQVEAPTTTRLDHDSILTLSQADGKRASQQTFCQVGETKYEDVKPCSITKNVIYSIAQLGNSNTSFALAEV